MHTDTRLHAKTKNSSIPSIHPSIHPFIHPGINLKTYRVLREDPVRVSMFLALVTDFLQSHGMSYELANYLEAVLMMAMINFQNTLVPRKNTFIQSIPNLKPNPYPRFGRACLSHVFHPCNSIMRS